MPGFFVPLGFWVEEGREVGEHCSYFSSQNSLKVRFQGERSSREVEGNNEERVASALQEDIGSSCLTGFFLNMGAVTSN